MKIEDRLLELVRVKPVLLWDLQAELGLSIRKMVNVATLLKKDKLIEVVECGSDVNEAMVWITAKGRELLDLPILPEDETTGLTKQRVHKKMVRFVFEIDVVQSDGVEVVESYAKRALERRIKSVKGYELFAIVSVRKK